MAFVLFFPVRPNWSLPSMTLANPPTKTSRLTLPYIVLFQSFRHCPSSKTLRATSWKWNTQTVCHQKIPAQVSSGLQTSSHSTRCEWWLMASSPVRHPWTLGYTRALCLAPCCSCAISTIFPVLSDHKCVSSRMTVFSTGRSTLAKTTSSCSKTYSSWRHGQDSEGWSAPGNAISWVYAASHPTYTPWKTTSWSKSHQSPTLEFISPRICLGLV